MTRFCWLKTYSQLKKFAGYSSTSKFTVTIVHFEGLNAYNSSYRHVYPRRNIKGKKIYSPLQCY